MGRMTISFGQNDNLIWAELRRHLGRMTTSFRQNYEMPQGLVNDI